MSKPRFIDFAAVKAAVKMEDVLARYGLLEGFKRGSDSLSGKCPIHQGTNPTQFRVSLSKNCWNCFSDCQCGGNVLDFVEKMENCSTIEAANRLADWFHLDVEQLNGEREPRTPPKANGPPAKPPTASSELGATSAPASQSPSSHAPAPSFRPPPGKPEPVEHGVNKKLGFTLADKLDYTHAYLAERGLTPATIAEFGVGFCQAGSMIGRIAIPIADIHGQLVGFAGRWPGEPPTKETPKYKLPKGFKKSVEVFHLHRALKEPPEQPLILVEGFFDVMKLWQHGFRKVAALMGSSLSAAQEELITRATTASSTILVMFDEDDAGRAAREDVLLRLARKCFVRLITFPKEGQQPEHLTEQELHDLMGGPS